MKHGYDLIRPVSGLRPYTPVYTDLDEAALFIFEELVWYNKEATHFK